MKQISIKTFLIGCLAITAFVNSSSCSSVRNTVPSKEKSFMFETDSSKVVFMVNDSLLNFINNADSLSLYELCSPLIVNDTINTEIGTDTISSFRMKKNNIAISQEMITILKFIVGDINVYQEDIPVAKQPYSPYIALNFHAAEENIFLLYSFSTKQLAFATKKETLLMCRIKDCYSLERWLHKMLPENDYINSIFNER